jgi:leucyl-tRNA synthetase
MVSELTNDDLDKLYERLKHHVKVTDDEGLSSDELEKMVQESNQNIKQVTEELRASVAEFSSQVNTISTQVSKQNTVVLGLQKTLEATTSDLKQSVDGNFNNLSRQIQALHNMVIAALPSIALQATEKLGGKMPP